MDHDWITPRIALGAAVEDRHDAHELLIQGITHVVNLYLGHPDDSYFGGSDVSLHYFGIFDGENDPDLARANINGAIEAVRGALAAAPHHKVYVHCAAGISRSAAVVVGYLMRSEELSMAEALRRVRDCRPCVNPHPAHLMTLLEIFRAPDPATNQNATPTWRYGPQV
ncbi:MAG: dual specificity protein phosphatase family protein [Candidatus Sericytochromatia bacterium]|nr:dual specificity protein phosphatase family protein [Candidatus Tanganyikabacteria bacterium]